MDADGACEAAQEGDLPALRRAVKEGVDINQPDVDGDTPLALGEIVIYAHLAYSLPILFSKPKGLHRRG